MFLGGSYNGTWKRFALASIACMAFKVAADSGGLGLGRGNSLLEGTDPELNWNKEGTISSWSWGWGDDMVRKADPGPSWKKFLDEDKK